MSTVKPLKLGCVRVSDIKLGLPWVVFLGSDFRSSATERKKKIHIRTDVNILVREYYAIHKIYVQNFLGEILFS